MLLTVIIPARNEKFLQKTIENVLANIKGDTEIIAICDGYWPDPPIQDHPRVTLLHHSESLGQRQSINRAANLARGKFIMKLDAHCAVDEGFDVKLAADCEYDWTVIPRMYNLDVVRWQPKLHKRTDYMYIGWNDKTEMRALYYTGKDFRKWHDRTELIDDTMCCMGPCFFMHKARFLELGGCDENHGSWGQQGIEVALKAWLSGGALKVNKNTWFAHWFRGGDGGFPYPISGRQVDNARKYSMDLWLNNKWPQQKRNIRWLIDKFDPPTWEGRLPEMDDSKRTEMQSFFYKTIHLKGHDPRWRGIKMIKMPTDIVLYQMAIWERRPDFIIEIGTAFCASALMFADFCDMVGNGQVISIDPTPRGELIEHSRITYLRGDSKDDNIISQIKDIIRRQHTWNREPKVMLSIDGNHARQQVKWELHKYADIVTSGQFMVVEDCYGRQGELVGPGEARDWFLARNRDYKLTDFDAQFVFGFTKGGWLLKK